MIAKLETIGGAEFVTVSIPVSKRASASGKTTIIASSNGNQATTVQVDGKPLVIGFNAYIK